MKRFVSVFLICLSAVSAFGDTIYVDANGTGDYSTIQDAINAASNGDVIILQPGTYTGSGNKNISYLGKAITVRSINPYDPNVVNSTVIDGQMSSGDGFIFQSGEGPDSVLSGLTIAHFQIYPDGEGFGIVSSSSPMVSRCRLVDNMAIAGGAGIYNTGNIFIIDCAFIDNSSVMGYPPGIYNSGSINVINSVFSNYDQYEIHNDYSGVANFTNCLFKGGLWNQHASQVNVSNCTFMGAYSIFNYDESGLNIINSILWGSGYIEGGTGITISYSCIQGGYEGAGNIDSDPCFVSGPDGDYYLSQIAAGQLTNSPCIDTGSDSAVKLKMSLKTTRTDELNDTETVDMGYHYSKPPAGDFIPDGIVNFLDFAVLGSQWRQIPGIPSADIAPPGGDGVVDYEDLAVFCQGWLY